MILIVGTLLSVLLIAQVPSPTSPDDPYIVVTRAEVPSYPAVAEGLGLEGSVVLDVSIKDSYVVDITVVSSPSHWLSDPTVANVSEWRVRSYPNAEATFRTTFVYRLDQEETLVPENPEVRLRLPTFVEVVQRPVGPTVSTH
jgi:hypothetical protein